MQYTLTQYFDVHIVERKKRRIVDKGYYKHCEKKFSKMIPKQISDIDTEWLQDILEKVDKTKWNPEDCNIIGLSLNTSKCEDELFECCNVSFNVSNKAQCGKTKNYSYTVWKFENPCATQILRQINFTAFNHRVRNQNCNLKARL